MSSGIILASCIAIVLLASQFGVAPRFRGHRVAFAILSSNVAISNPEALPQSPAVTMDDADQAYAAWHDARPGMGQGVYVARKLASGSWASPVKIPGSNAAPPHSPAIAAGSGHQVYVAWVSGFPETRSDIRFAWSIDGGHTWQGPVQVNADTGDIAGHPDLAVDIQGNVYLVWSDLGVFGDPHSRDIKWAMRPAGQHMWTEPTLVHPGLEVLTEQSRPSITADGIGNVYAVWEDARHGPGDPRAIYAARLPAGGGQWQPSRRVDHRPGRTNVGPDIAAASGGAVHAVWEDGSTGAVYSASLQAGAKAWGGPTCITKCINGEAKVENGEWQGGRGVRGEGESAPRIAVDDYGIAYAVWQDDRSGDWDIYRAVRWPVAAGWGASIRVNDDEGTAGQKTPALAAGEAGYTVAVWIDQRRRPSGTVFATEFRSTIHTLRLPFLAR